MIAAVTASNGRADLAIRLGLQSLEQRREEDALPAVIAAIERTPRDVNLLHVAGLMHRAVGDLPAAITALDGAIALGDYNARLLHARARIAAEAGRPSLEWYRRARALAPTDGDIILGEAAALYALRNVAEAEGLLSAMLREHPGWIPGHEELVRYRHLQGDHDGSLGDLDAAIAGAPGDPRLHHLKAMVLYRRGAGEEAIETLAKARTIVGEVDVLKVATAIVTTECGSVSAGDTAFSQLDPFSDPDLFTHWLRHLLRREEPERVSALMERLPPHLLKLAWPYLSMAWRLIGDTRAAWLERQSFITTTDIIEDGDSLEKLAGCLRDLHHARHAPIDQSVRGGTQTDGPLLSRIDPDIAAIRRRLMDQVKGYIAGLPPGEPRHPLLGAIPRHPRFVGSWSVRLSDGGYHEPHVHGEGWLSAVFYVRVPHTQGTEGWLTLGEPQRSLRTGLQPFMEVRPQAGRLVLLPSTTWHATRPFGSGERLTIAFDIA